MKNKSELVKAVEKNLEAKGFKPESHAQAEHFVGAVIEEMVEAIKDDGLMLIGFGTFKTVERAAHMGTNPATGEKMEIPAKMAVKFSPSQALKDAVNE